jgi:tungstate transport system ATP-binding protein
VALTGANGSGKSTLLHVLAFLAAPTSGRLWFGGEEVTTDRLRALRRRVGILLQNPYLLHATVGANVEVGLRARGVARAERHAKVREALGRLGLEGFELRRAQGLSGGEAQRVALARLLVLEPEVMLLDEPTNHLDAESAARIEETVAWAHRERGVTVVLSSHDGTLAHRLGARILRMDEGRLTQGGLENVFLGSPVTGEPGLFAVSGIVLAVGRLPHDARAVSIGARDIVLSRPPVSSAAANQLVGTVTKAELLADGELLVTVFCGVPVRCIVGPDTWRTLGLNVGQPAVVSLDAAALEAS